MDYRQEVLEHKFSDLAAQLDIHLENRFGSEFSLHPRRKKHGSGTNPAFDGLFATTVAFTLGYGSQYGRGYLVNIDIRTLDKVPSDFREMIYREAFDFIAPRLAVFFPERSLNIVLDCGLLKLVGDFSL